MKKSLLYILIALTSINSALAQAHSNNSETQRYHPTTHQPHQEKSFFQAVDKHYRSQTKRINAISASLLGLPYLDNDTGKDKPVKQTGNPLYRFSSFDCMTYVEAVLAGVMSHSKQSFGPKLVDIRYKHGKVSFITRNHFPSADWFPNNKGKLVEATYRVSGKATKIASALINKRAWYHHFTLDNIQDGDLDITQRQHLLAKLRRESNKMPTKMVHLPYVPLTDLFVKTAPHHIKVNTALLKRIPDGSIISMVRPNWPIKDRIGTNMNVSHMGFAIRKQGQLYFREASEIKGKIVDVNFVQYLYYYYRESKTLKGFNVHVLAPKYHV
ncbi:hypothetical protein MSP8887_02527 [Marinomonas spartinae]|uniref:N-acetylmuramoyl-L-alanine amidase-like domain-containing protein n=1 Tax=Marinomonas spartinae TaxID=1792290 RepID=UPI000808FF5A|nr:N-acetylmuramoyl-L-alanine amidase-like domain-containing protein [Marinomonas spartinae]SBS36094.1 hypothetical protein MSP8887_02527 [Marinomonas spartinae]